MPESIENFRRVVRGYDPTQVDHHMNELAQAAASVWQEAAERANQISDLKADNGQLRIEVEGHAKRVRVLEKSLKEAAEPSYAGLGEHIAAILTLVDNEAYELRIRAQAHAAKSRALADENALATRQDADEYARETIGAADDEAARMLEETRQKADSLLEDARQQRDKFLEDARQQGDRLLKGADRQAMARQDADRQAMARREEAEAVYEKARAKAAAAAVDFETTLAARREASALEFATQVTAAEKQLAAIRLRSVHARSESERAQQEAASKIAQQLEQATARAQTLVAEAKAKAERIRDNSERELAAATQRRNSINVQLSNVRHELAALGDPQQKTEPMQQAEAKPNGAKNGATAQAEPNGAKNGATAQAEPNGAKNGATAQADVPEKQRV